MSREKHASDIQVQQLRVGTSILEDGRRPRATGRKLTLRTGR